MDYSLDLDLDLETRDHRSASHPDTTGRLTEIGHDARLASPNVSKPARGKWAAGANSDMGVVFHTPPGEWPPYTLVGWQ